MSSLYFSKSFSQESFHPAAFFEEAAAVCWGPIPEATVTFRTCAWGEGAGLASAPRNLTPVWCWAGAGWVSPGRFWSP